MLIVQKIGGFCQITETWHAIAVESVVKRLLSLSVLRKEAIVVVTIFGGVHAHKVTASLVLEHRFNHDLFHLGRHAYETLDVVFLIEIEKLIGHLINLI